MFEADKSYICTSITGARPCFKEVNGNDDFQTEDFVMIDSNGNRVEYIRGMIRPALNTPMYCLSTDGTAVLKCKVINDLLSDVVPGKIRNAIRHTMSCITGGSVSDNTVRRLYDILIPTEVQCASDTDKYVTTRMINRWMCERIMDYSSRCGDSLIADNLTFLCVELLGEMAGVAYVELCKFGKCKNVTVEIDIDSTRDDDRVKWVVDGIGLKEFMKKFSTCESMHMPLWIWPSNTTSTDRIMSYISNIMSGH